MRKRKPKAASQCSTHNCVRAVLPTFDRCYRHVTRRALVREIVRLTDGNLDSIMLRTGKSKLTFQKVCSLPSFDGTGLPCGQDAITRSGLCREHAVSIRSRALA